MIKNFFNSVLVRETGISLFFKISQAFFSFMTTVLLARILGAEGYGIYAYAFAFVMLLSMPAQAGLPTLVIRETARGMAEGKPELVQGIWRWATKVAVLISLSLLFVIGLFFLLLKGKKFGVKEWTFFWAFLFIPFMCLSNLRGAALRGLHKVVIGQLPEFFIRPALFFAFLCIEFFLFHQRLTPPQAMALNVFSAVLAFIIGTWLLWRNTPLSIYKAIPVYDGKKWFSSFLPLAFTAGMWVINSQADVVMLGIFKPPAEVGIYRVAVQIALVASFGLQAVNMVVAPRFATFYTKREMEKLQRLVTRSAQAVLAFNLIITSFFILFGKIFLDLVFGKEFIIAYIPLLILLIGQLVNSAAGSVGFLLNMTGHEKDTARGMTLAAGINIMLNFSLIPSLGPKGAAIATAISMITWNVILWWFVRRRLGINSLAFDFKFGS
ncbi:MAG: flippase [Candidatus Desulfofervidus auxilii]|nr:flippase [Candidatus Desulfofervidus auxilii]